MFRTLDVIMICALIGSAAWTFKVKYDSEVAMAELARLERRIQIEKEAIDILRADWSLLTSPDRLEHLVGRYGAELAIAPAAPEQVGTLDEIPDRPPAAEDGGFATAPDARTVTGTIAKPEDKR